MLAAPLFERGTQTTNNLQLELSMTTQQEYYKIVQDVQKLIEGKTS
jgi:hypothetical protein